MKRSQAERRHNDWKKVRRKERIITNVYRDHEWYDEFWSKQEHRLSKNKVHCSCPICSAKSNRNGYKASDLRKIEKLDSSMNDLLYY